MNIFVKLVLVKMCLFCDICDCITGKQMHHNAPAVFPFYLIYCIYTLALGGNSSIKINSSQGSKIHDLCLPQKPHRELLIEVEGNSFIVPAFVQYMSVLCS